MKREEKYLQKTENNKSIKKSLWTVLGVCVVSIVAVAIIFIPKALSSRKTNPIEINKIKKPEGFTLESYQESTAKEKTLFPDNSENMNVDNAWHEIVLPKEDMNVPSKQLIRKKADYFTWEDYQTLTPEEQMVFPDEFESMDAYQAWHKSVQLTDKQNLTVPEVDLNGKKAEDFTWEEHQALTLEEQMVFPDKFESMDAYNVWYESVKPKEEHCVPVIDRGDKTPEDYTWEEYQQLSIEEQMVFPDYFESLSAYQEWYDNTCSEE